MAGDEQEHAGRLRAHAEELRAHADELETQWEQHQTLAAIGGFVVAAGHLEATMCHLVEWLQDAKSQGISDKTRRLSWSALIKRLIQLAEESEEDDEVKALLEEHDLDTAMEMRHSLVHSRIFITGEGLHAIRYRIKGPDADAVLLIGNRSQIDETRNRLRELNRRLNLLLPDSLRAYEHESQPQG